MPVLSKAALKLLFLTDEELSEESFIDLIDTLMEWREGLADGKILGAVAGVPAWIDAPSGGSMTAAEIRDALITLLGTDRLPASAIKDLPAPLTAEELRDELESLSGADRLDASAIRNLPTYTLPVATDTVLGGVKIPAGGPISVDGAGNLTLSPWAAALLIIPWLSVDNFEGYTDGSHASLAGGISWAGAAEAFPPSAVVSSDNFESYTDGSHASLSGGSGWADDAEATLDYPPASDNFESYTDGSHASLSGGSGWAGDATAVLFV